VSIVQFPLSPQVSVQKCTSFFQAVLAHFTIIFKIEVLVFALYAPKQKELFVYCCLSIVVFHCKIGYPYLCTLCDSTNQIMLPITNIALLSSYH